MIYLVCTTSFSGNFFGKSYVNVYTCDVGCHVTVLVAMNKGGGKTQRLTPLFRKFLYTCVCGEVSLQLERLFPLQSRTDGCFQSGRRLLLKMRKISFVHMYFSKNKTKFSGDSHILYKIA